MMRIAAFVLLHSLVAVAPSAAQTSRVELDHVFVVVEPGGMDAIAALRTAGLTVDERVARHAGQGTASVAVIFENAYLELIWPDSSVSVEPEHAASAEWFHAAGAWRTTGHSPFGFGLRRVPGDTAALPVAVEREPAEWLEPGAAYELLRQPADSLAAEFFVVPPSSALPAWIGRVRKGTPELLEHSGGGSHVALARMHAPPGHEPVAFGLLRPSRIETVPASQPLLELILTDRPERQRSDLRPVLPVVIVR